MGKGPMPINDSQKIIVYTDGGARGNPGPAACGYTINGKPYGEFLGIKTNNEAEYAGVIEALKKIVTLLGKTEAKKSEVDVSMDSELLVRQFNNEYKVREGHLQLLYVQAHNLILDFKKVAFRHVPRKENSAADKVVNEVLDAHEKL